MNWQNNIQGSIVVCDENGIITEMNSFARGAFTKYGGSELLGQDLRDCHPGESKEKLEELLRNPRLNCYTVEKHGERKLIYQAPIFDDGVFKGLVELSLPIPNQLPHFIRS